MSAICLCALLPLSDAVSAVMVVPIFAPIIIANAGASQIIQPLSAASVMICIAACECKSAVIIKPTPANIQRLVY